MGCADDVIFRTQGWDTKIVSEFNQIEDKIGFIYPNDGHNGEALGTHGFFHKNWFNTLSYISPPIFTVDYSDNYTMDVAKLINRCFYRSDILIEHMHWTIGKSEFDSTSKNAHLRRLQNDNAAIYKNQLTQQMIFDDANKLKSKMRNINE